MSIIENFSLDHIKNLSQNEAKEYLIKYFVPLTDGKHAFYMNGKFNISETKDIKSTYFNRMSKELNEYYFKDFTALKSITYQLNKDLYIGNEINLCPKMKAKKTKSFDEYDDKTKEGVIAMLKFIKEVLASDNKDVYDYLIKWIANMLQGNKNDSCLYLKGEQGIGKSTLFDFLFEFVIGMPLCYKDGSEPLRSNFNGILAGKLLVVFEELENISANEWTFISSKLKRYITSDVYSIEEKFLKSIQTNNMNNYIINSNNDAIRDDDGRRYFILDVSHKYRENFEYFGKLRKKAFNDLVGEAFYAYMLEVNTDGFIPQNFPHTQSKLNSFVKRLDKVYEFIKEEFILSNTNLKHTTKELYELYIHFCQMHNYKKIDKHSFAEKLQHVNIIYKKTNGNNYYKYSVDALKEIATKYKWLHELDDVIDNNSEEEDANDMQSEIQNLKDIIEKQKQQIEELSKKIKVVENPENDLFAEF